MTANTSINPPVRGPAQRRRMHPTRRISLTVGILYVLTFVSIPTLALYKPVKDDAGAFVLGRRQHRRVAVGRSVRGHRRPGRHQHRRSAVPVTKRVSQTAALGFVAARLVETCLIFVSVVSLLTIMTLRNDVAGTAGTDSASLVTMSHSLVATYNWTFLLSQSLMPVACDLLLGYVLYRSALVPRILPIVAFIGAPLLLASDVAVYFGAYSQVSPIAVLAALPVAVFELSLGIWLIIKGFKPTPLTADDASTRHGHPDTQQTGSLQP